MRHLCAELLAQVNTRLEAMQNGGNSLTENEVAAIRRILDITARVVTAPAETDLRESLASPQAQAEVEAIRNGAYDGDAALFGKLKQANEARLAVISPKSLSRYVGLLEL